MRRYSNRKATFARTRKSYTWVKTAQRYAPQFAGESTARLKVILFPYILKGIYGEAMVQMASLETNLLKALRRCQNPATRRPAGVYFDCKIA